MSIEATERPDRRVSAAIEQLQGLIRQHYPAAEFEVSTDPEEPENVHLITTVDLEDPDEVLDLVLDRVLELQVEQRIPVHVIPVRSPQRILQSLDEPRRNRPLRPAGSASLARDVLGQH